MPNAVRTDAFGCQRGYGDLGPKCMTLDNRVDTEARQRLPAAIEEHALLRLTLAGKPLQLQDGIGP